MAPSMSSKPEVRLVVLISHWYVTLEESMGTLPPCSRVNAHAVSSDVNT